MLQLHDQDSHLFGSVLYKNLDSLMNSRWIIHIGAHDLRICICNFFKPSDISSSGLACILCMWPLLSPQEPRYCQNYDDPENTV